MSPREHAATEKERQDGPPSNASASAAISLLTDSDSGVVDACRAQILRWGPTVRPLVRRAIEQGGELAQEARRVLRTLDLGVWREQMIAFVGDVPAVGPMTWQQLQRGALLLAGFDRMDRVDVGLVESTLATYADDLRPRAEGKSAITQARLLAGYLSSQLGYGGSETSFYDLANIHLDEVVTIRRGVPVSLTLLYLLIGRRMGLDVAGVMIPDHFLLRVHGTRPVLIDPYHEGRQVTKADCTRYLRQAGYSLHTTSYLEDVHDRQILDCLLRNLLRVYGYREDHELCSVLESMRQALMRD